VQENHGKNIERAFGGDFGALGGGGPTPGKRETENPSRKASQLNWGAKSVRGVGEGGAGGEKSSFRKRACPLEKKSREKKKKSGGWGD